MKVPKSLEEIKITALEQIAVLENEDEKERRWKEIAILCNTDYNDMMQNQDIISVVSSINEIKWFYELDPESIEQKFEFEYEGIKYKLIKEMNELVFGQWVDITTYTELHQNNYWTATKYIIALCSSIEGQEHSYPKTEKELLERLNVIENIGLDVIYGYTSYFNLKKKAWKNLSNLSLQLNSIQQNIVDSGQDTIKNGAGQGFFMTYVGVILLILMICVGWIYTKCYIPLVSKMKGLRSNKK